MHQSTKDYGQATLLILNSSNSRYLNWHSTLHYEQCVRFIADWYKTFYLQQNIDMYQLTVAQIKEYLGEAQKQRLQWTK